MRHSFPLGLLLLVSAMIGGPATAGQEEVDVQALLEAREWPALLARDARVGFTVSSAREARADLERGELQGAARAGALLALAAGGNVADRPLITVDIQAADPIVSQGAILALGELRPAPLGLLRTLTQDPVLAAAAVLAMVRSGDANARAEVARWAASDGPLSVVAGASLAALDGGQEAPSAGAAAALFELRWVAARRYGFVDGIRWRVHLERDLARSDVFLDRVILGASRHLSETPRQDHLLEITLAGGTPDRLRGVVAGMPEALGKLLVSGLWKPGGDEEWRAILEEIERQGSSSEHVDLLISAAAESGLDREAGLLLLRANSHEGYELVSQDLTSPSAERRLALAEALGGLKEPAHVTDISRMRRDEDPRVRAAALISLVRLGDRASVDTLAGLLEGGPGAARDNAVEMLCRASSDLRLIGYLEGLLLLGDLPDAQALRVQLCLRRLGRLQPKPALREALRQSARDLGLRGIFVLSVESNAFPEELELLRDLFPVEGDFEINVALARTLIVHRDPGALGLLRSAIWKGPWNRSVLAAGLLVRHGGIKTLHDELASPPLRVTDADLRRVGFALGEWGGLTEVDVLARRRRPGDPALQGAFLGALVTRTQ